MTHSEAISREERSLSYVLLDGTYLGEDIDKAKKVERIILIMMNKIKVEHCDY